MKIVTIMWASYLPLMQETAAQLDIELQAYSTKQLTTYPELVHDALVKLQQADTILLWRTNDAFWEELEPELRSLRERIPLIVVSGDPSTWALSTLNPEIIATVYRYILLNGRANMENMFRYLLNSLFDSTIKYAAPEEVAWQGIHHPGLGEVFQTTEDYLTCYRNHLSFTPQAYVGLLYPRTNWVSGNLAVESALIANLEALGLGVIPIFLYALKDKALGNLSGVEVIERYLMQDSRVLVNSIIKLTAFFLANTRGGIKQSEATDGAKLLKRLNIPLFAPVISYYKDPEAWLNDPNGLGSQVAWSIAMPEFEGVIEPMVVGATHGIAQPEGETYVPLPERIKKLASRVAAWVRLCGKPNHEKRVALILHNNPCASVEATVGAGAHLDTLESVADILKKLEALGYQVNPPADGKALIDEIMGKKAISEFRWTTVDEIVAKGGTLDLITTETYLSWFEELPPSKREHMCQAWGNPPGEAKDGIPPAMVHEGRIAITGVSFGNAVVCVQPKRGCAGPRCDGEVCKILHDPAVPPPHQYVATYKWLSRVFGADAIIHVGTHGNMEFLPGKATGLSSGCLPDISIDTMPHLYIYNADNPPEGIIAKRRANAVLVDHLQTVMVQGEFYGDLDQTARLLEEYAKYQHTEPAKAHTISHMIMEKVKTLNLLDGRTELTHANFPEMLGVIHERLSLLKNTTIPKGMHLFGHLPEGEKLVDFIYAIMRYETGPESLRGVVSGLLQRLSTLEDEALRDKTEALARDMCRAYVLSGTPLDVTLGMDYRPLPDDVMKVRTLEEEISKIMADVQASDEMGSLINGLTGGFIEPGPSGLITRGRADILPTGRNFYALDPQRIPSPAAWMIGKKLADSTLAKYLEEEGSYPENIAFYWQCSDIMWADGEGLAQMMYLLGAKPLWQENGRCKGYEIMAQAELGRPRIDITVRVSGITRDNFPATIDMLDSVVQSVAILDEPLEQNFIRKHTLERLGQNTITDSEALRQATYRIFASQPGTYQAGTQLAVYASAWKTEQDLTDVFLYWNGYAYGKGSFGVSAHASLKENLKTVVLSFNKTVTDEYDLTGCCCYFGAHGGMINAAQLVSGRKIRNYYGDTREQDQVSVRTLSDELRRIARAKILNPVWIEGMKEHGYKGASEISKRVGRLYGWQATTKAVDGTVFDDITRTFMMDKENRAFFEANNPWALEELSRRLIEAAERGLWEPAADVKQALKQVYVEIEGWIEERMGEVHGEFQGGSVDIITSDQVSTWKKKMQEVLS